MNRTVLSRIVPALALGAGLLTFGGAASGAVISQVPGALAFPGGTLLDSVERDIAGLDAGNNVVFTGTLWASVYWNAGGTLDFYYQYQNDANSSPDGVLRISSTSFTGFTTDFFYLVDDGGSLPAPFLSWGVDTPNQATRSTAGPGDPLGSTVGFGSFQPNGAIDPGSTSAILVVRTNALRYIVGSTQVIDGGVDTVSTFAPAVPEPGTYALLGSGLIGMFIAARRRRKS